MCIGGVLAGVDGGTGGKASMGRYGCWWSVGLLIVNGMLGLVVVWLLR